MSREILERFVGRWSGTCRTWFQPGQLADESDVSGRIEFVVGGQFLRHAYTGSMQGKPRAGEELIAVNGITGRFQVAWIDDFHTTSGIILSEGDAIDGGFGVRGSYEVGGDHPAWDWRTDYVLDGDRLVITAYNVSPDGDEALAVETVYERA